MKIGIKDSAVEFSLFHVACGGKEEKGKGGFNVVRQKTSAKENTIALDATGIPASPTGNQNLTEDQSRAVLEYFRNL
jgi:hypothetical protein